MLVFFFFCAGRSCAVQLLKISWQTPDSPASFFLVFTSRCRSSKHTTHNLKQRFPSDGMRMYHMYTRGKKYKISPVSKRRNTVRSTSYHTSCAKSACWCRGRFTLVNRSNTPTGGDIFPPAGAVSNTNPCGMSCSQPSPMLPRIHVH